MKIMYHKLMLKITYELWHIWHVRLRWFLDRKFYGTHHYYEDHAWWMPCCNGNSGGWRTTFCDSLENPYTGWRYHESMIEQLLEEKKG